MKEATLKIEIDPPEDGWTAVKLSHGKNQYSFFPSHVPYDSISDLITALSSVASNRNGEFKVRWNDEPIEHEFVFKLKNNHVEFLVFLTNRRDLLSFTEITHALNFAYDGSIDEIVRPFWRALRQIESKQSQAEYEKQWREPFPAKEMLELTEKMMTVK